MSLLNLGFNLRHNLLDPNCTSLTLAARENWIHYLPAKPEASFLLASQKDLTASEQKQKKHHAPYIYLTLFERRISDGGMMNFAAWIRLLRFGIRYSAFAVKTSGKRRDPAFVKLMLLRRAGPVELALD